MIDLDNYYAILDSSKIDRGIKNAMVSAFTRRLELFGNDLFFFREPFTPVSLTGTECFLRCRHCCSYYLRHMLDGSDGKLNALAKALANKGKNGIILSGGSLPDGSVPVYLQSEEIIRIKSDTGLKISAHTGIVNKDQAYLFSGFLDMALVDVIGSDETIRDILGISAIVKDYEDTLSNLSFFGTRLAPHVIAGLHNGGLKGEFRALELINKFKPVVVVIVVFIPTTGTPSENLEPPKFNDIIKIITKAREMFEVPVSLSCVRPGGRYRHFLDKFAILSGIDRIAVPSRNAYDTALKVGLNIIEVPGSCCSCDVI